MPEELNVPESLDASWLTIEYIQKNGWYPVCDEWLQHYPDGMHFEDTGYGEVPWKSRSEFKEGDIIIFDEYREWEDEGKYETDRFMRVEKEDIEEYERGERDMLPCGIVVHAPADAKA